MQIGITQQEIDKGVTFQEAITKVKHLNVDTGSLPDFYRIFTGFSPGLEQK